MASNVELEVVWRPQVPNYTNGVRDGLALAEYLLVRVDRYDNGANVNVLRLDFADYAGLEAEFIAGAATTVLNTSMQTAIDAATWAPENLTAPQRALLDTEYEET